MKRISGILYILVQVFTSKSCLITLMWVILAMLFLLYVDQFWPILP